MWKLILSSFKTTNNCIILVTPLIVFLSIFNWYYVYAADSINTIPKLFLSAITMLIMISIFLSAWLYMAKKTISISKKVFVFDKDRNDALGKLFLALPTGISKLFLPIIGVIAIYLLLYSTLFYIINFIIENFIGIIHFNSFDFQTLQLSNGEFLEEVKLLSDKELKVFNYWLLLLILGSSAISYFTTYWIPEVVYNYKNSLNALKNSIVKAIANPLDTFLVFLVIYSIIFIMSLLNIIVMANPILYFLVSLFYYYFIVFVIVLLFTYYEQKYINERQ